MANKKITDLVALTSADSTDLLEIVDVSANSNKKVTVAGLTSGLSGITNAQLSTTSGELGAVWTTWTPSWTNLTVGNATVVARYTRVGKTISGEVNVILGNTSSVASGVAVNLPVAPNTRYSTMKFATVGTAIYVDEGTDSYGGQVVIDRSTTAMTLLCSTANATYSDMNPVSGAAPFTWTPANADAIAFKFEYEAA